MSSRAGGGLSNKVEKTKGAQRFMMENDRGTGLEPGGDPDRERLAAHERLSTGALASWMRACAAHPWRVVGAWVGIIAGMVLLVATVGGQLKDEFEIPGSDTQKATDLIESEFASEQGGVLNVVVAAPQGERLDKPEYRAAILKAVARLQSPEFKPTEDKAGLASVGNLFNPNNVSDDARIAYAEAQFDRVIYEDRDSVVAVQDAVRETLEPVGLTVEFNGDAEFPPIEQGTQELLGLLAALIVLLVVFRTITAAAIRSRWRSPLWRAPSCALRPRRPDGHQHDHAAARLDDRPRRRDRLFAVHRHASAYLRGTLATRRRGREGWSAAARRSSPG